MTLVKAWAAREAQGSLQPLNFDLPPPGAEEVEVKVAHCGVCHTDLMFVDNEWGMTHYPFVPGHEIVGTVTRLGEVAARKGLSLGQTVGIGWNKESCLHCDPCLDGETHLCETVKATIMGDHGGFASHIKTHWHWTVPLPADIPAAEAGPLFCAGITVFAPLLAYGLRPTDRVGVFGIGGLGHLALQFAKAWGADTVAFSSSPAKSEEAKGFGADAVVSSTDPSQWEAWKGKFDLLIITSFANHGWDKVVEMLAPKGRLHVVGLANEPISLPITSLVMKQRQLSSSPTGSRNALGRMLGFAGRHQIKPKTEHFPMSKVNDAIARVRSGKANYRVVLDADFE